MSTYKTRQLAIEFERRVQIMMPEKEFYEKLDTETIYSFLNQYLDLYIESIFKNLDLLQTEDRRFPNVDNILQTLTKTQRLSAEEATNRSIYIELPEDFYMYVKSDSIVSKYYRFKSDYTINTSNQTNSVSNTFSNQKEVEKISEGPNDNLKILRNPVAYLNNFGGTEVLSVLHDRYTKIDAVNLTYYKKPSHFGIVSEANNIEQSVQKEYPYYKSVDCELPDSAFDDLVAGAVDLYVNYVAGAEARKRQMNEAAKKQNEDKRE